MTNPKVTTEIRLVVVNSAGKVYGKYMKKRGIEKAFEDAAKYDDHPLGRVATIERRTVTTTPWVPVTDKPRDSRE